MQNISKTAAVLEHIIDKHLYPFQKQFVTDQSRFKIYNKARQIGISEALAFDAWFKVFKREPVYFVSRTQKQSIYLMDKFYRWGKLFKQCGVRIKYEVESKSEAVINGVDIKSLSSNSFGDEGYTGNVMLDEFALFQNDEDIYKAVFPITTRGFALSIVSRPFGQSNLHHDIFTGTDKYASYKRYKTDLRDAIRQGCPINYNEMADGFGGETSEGFRENYCCEFIDESTAFLPYELIRSCIGDEIETEGEYFIGVDIGRVHDLTAVAIGKKVGEVMYVAQVDVLKGTEFATQKQFIVDKVKLLNVRAGLIDQSGIGMNLSEDISKECYQISGVTFNAQNKEEMVYHLKAAMEQKRIVIPADKQLISDMHSMQRIPRNNRVIFDAPRNVHGHADRFWAVALMLEASNSAGVGMHFGALR